MELPVPASYKDAKQGGKILLCPDGYEFTKVKTETAKVHYVCRKKTKFGCKVTAAVATKDDMIVRITGEHVHDNDLVKTAVMEKENEAVKSAARNPTVSPRTALANLTNDVMASTSTSTAVNYLSKTKTFTKKIQRARNNLLSCGDVPKTWEEMANIPDDLKKTASGEEFLICNKKIKESEEELIIGFSSPTGLEILDTAQFWYGDGTFDIAKSTLFTQVFIIIGKSLTGKNVPCCFFLLPNKEYETYKMMFLELKVRGLSPPRIFYCDFEAAIAKAVSELFPEVNIYGCDAHFKRAIRKNMQRFHLIQVYNREEEFQTFIRYFWGLSLVPTDQVVKVWEEFVLPAFPEVEEGDWENVTEDNANDFLDYLEKTWIGAVNQRTNKRRNPKIRHSMWNKYNAVSDGDETTTNSSEGFNNAIQMSLPHNANVFTLMKQFRTEDCLVALKLRDAVINADPEAGRSRRTDWQQRMEDLSELVQNYENITIKQYMAYLLDFFNHSLDFSKE